MSSNETVLTIIATGLFTLAGAFVGIIGVLLQQHFEKEEEKELKGSRVVLLAHRAAAVVGNHLRYIGINQSRLAPLLAENLEGTSPSKSDFDKAVSDALTVFPLPTPETIPFPVDDPYGFTLIALSGLVNELVVAANAPAAELKSGKRDIELISRFVVATNMAANVDYILGTAKREFEEYLDSLEVVYGKKLKKGEKERSATQFVEDLKRYHLSAVEIGKKNDSYRKYNEDYLRQRGWQ